MEARVTQFFLIILQLQHINRSGSDLGRSKKDFVDIAHDEIVLNVPDRLLAGINQVNGLDLAKKVTLIDVKVSCCKERPQLEQSRTHLLVQAAVTSRISPVFVRDLVLARISDESCCYGNVPKSLVHLVCCLQTLK